MKPDRFQEAFGRYCWAHSVILARETPVGPGFGFSDTIMSLPAQFIYSVIKLENTN